MIEEVFARRQHSPFEWSNFLLDWSTSCQHRCEQLWNQSVTFSYCFFSFDWKTPPARWGLWECTLWSLRWLKAAIKPLCLCSTGFMSGIWFLPFERETYLGDYLDSKSPNLTDRWLSRKRRRGGGGGGGGRCGQKQKTSSCCTSFKIKSASKHAPTPQKRTQGEEVSNLVFYAQSTSTVIWGQYAFCHYNAGREEGKNQHYLYTVESIHCQFITTIHFATKILTCQHSQNTLYNHETARCTIIKLRVLFS